MIELRSGKQLVYYGGAEAQSPVQQAVAWWSGGLAAYDAKNAVSYAASLIDLTGNGNHATTGLQPGWLNGVGWDFDGINDYIITPIVPTLNQTWSFIVKFADEEATVEDHYLFGIRGTAPTSRLWCVANSVNTSRLYSSAITPAVLPGIIVDASYHTMAVCGRYGYLDGSLDATMIVESVANALPVYIGAQNNNGVAAGFSGTKMSSWICFDNDVSAQISAISAAMP